MPITSHLLSVGVVSLSAQQTSLPRFEDYNVPLYQGKIYLPNWIRHSDSGGGAEWSDQTGKPVGKPKINFAGKYFIAFHSCGTSCGHHTLTDLSSGRELNTLRGFTISPTTASELFYRPNSKMLVVQSRVDSGNGASGCQERIFVLESERLKPITATKRGCQKFVNSN